MSWNRKKETVTRINCLDKVQIDNLTTTIPCLWNPYARAVLHIDGRYLFAEPVKQGRSLPQGKRGTLVFMVYEFNPHDKIYRRGKYLAGVHPEKKKPDWQTGALVTAGIDEGLIHAANVAARLRGDL
jgi:hypothetical protein